MTVSLADAPGTHQPMQTSADLPPPSGTPVQIRVDDLPPPTGRPMVPFAPAPQVQRNHRTFFRMVFAEAGVVLTLGLALGLLFAGAIPTSAAATIAILLAFAPLPGLLCIPLWIDRFEPEPARALIRCFFWGAGFSIVFAGTINTINGIAYGEDFAATISAPVFEELAKGLAVLWVFWRSRVHFDGVLDGVVYAFMAALGFAVVENILYYSMAAGESGSSLVGTFVMRGLITPLMHPLFTSMTGIGIGLASRTRRRWLRPVYILLGYACAVGLHHAWNAGATAAESGDAGRLLAAFITCFFTLVGLFVLMLVISRIERRVIVEGLTPEVRNGWLAPRDLQRLVATFDRLGAALRARRAGGDTRRAWRVYVLSATQLARFRQRRRAELAQGVVEHRVTEADLQAMLVRNRQVLYSLDPRLVG